MRIAHACRAFLAILHLAVLFMCAKGRVSSSNNASITPERFRHSRNFNIEWSQQLTLREKQLFIAQQSAAASAGRAGPGGVGGVGVGADAGAGGAGAEMGAECCPAVVEMTEPLAGTDERGVFVALYRDATNHQRFYEASCRTGVENRPCRFVDRKLANQSRCVQQFSYSYALLEDQSHGHHHHHHQQPPQPPPQQPPQEPEDNQAPGTQSPLSIIGYATGQTRWMLGYIKVRSGCRCMLFPKKTKKSKNKRLHHQDDGGPT